MILNFYLRFSTALSQSLLVSGNHTALGNDDVTKALPLQYFNNEFWQAQVELPEASITPIDIQYRYILKTQDGNQVIEWGDDRVIDLTTNAVKEYTLIDTWNHAGDVQNAFFTKPFQEVFLKSKHAAVKAKAVKIFTHQFKVKAPLLKENEALFIAGSTKSLGDWKTEAPLLLHKSGNWWTIKVNLGNETFPVAYKYGVFDTATEKLIDFESGNNRTLLGESGKGKITVIHDGFAQLPFPTWKGAGVAIPVFSLRTENSFGTGEFTDIRLLVDWAKICGLKLIQLLPINDTTATHSWLDSYPYAAISAFALHPMYLNIEKVAGGKNSALLKSLKPKQQELNALPTVDYDQVMEFKFSAIAALYQQQKNTFKDDIKFFEFFDLNRHWLVPYAAFCYLRYKYKTSDYNQWKTHQVYDETAIEKLAANTQKHYEQIALHYFTQYHLHLQLKEATAYAHKNGIVVKGDLPIGIYRYGCDAWMAPQLYNMDAQAGAPPDDFAVKGQNWGFPTYNWKKMQEDGFAWWRQRFEQMSEYFDAFRIDHILGFFRIWSIPIHAVEGIMGRFVPAIPIHINELYQNNISFQFHRYCKPYITDGIIYEKFGEQTNFVKDYFLSWNDGAWEMKPDFDTQKKVEQHFNIQPVSDINNYIKYGLFDLISNVLFFEEEGSQMQQYHFRIGMDQTTSFRDLDDHSKQQLKELYINYFFRRQDDFWRREAMNKLPELKRSTNMLVCGEDLGMVPDCVPDVMQQIGTLSLEIQRMPKDPKKEFFHPADAPYMSVVTPSTHDMSTIRGWWEEDTAKTQRFFNNQLGHYGNSPFYCSGWINREVLIQHLYSPAMWGIFQLQDIVGINEVLRRENPNDERINIPADPKHYWRYRMHMSLESLLQEINFNEELKSYVLASGR